MGCDKSCLNLNYPRYVFQSTHPHGVRLISINIKRLNIDVSIHAPARGATVFACASRFECNVSIHAPARGATVIALRHKQLRLFQSTHPHGVRQMHISNPNSSVCFNPRTRTGCDSVRDALQSCISVSIHAPARGATRISLRKCISTSVSIHAPARGAT